MLMTVCAATQAAARMATNGFISTLTSAQRVCARCGGVTGAGRAGVTAEQADINARLVRVEAAIAQCQRQAEAHMMLGASYY